MATTTWQKPPWLQPWVPGNNNNNNNNNNTFSWSTKHVTHCNKSTNNNDWNCSHCNSSNQSFRNVTECTLCGLSDCDRNRIRANAFYQFGIISSPQISLLPTDIPFFIYPLAKPKITYYLKAECDGITIRFVVNLNDIKQRTNYNGNVCRIRFEIKNTSNQKYKGIKKIIYKPVKPATFDTFLQAPYDGYYELDIEALIEYKIGRKMYSKTSPKTQLIINLKGATFCHQYSLKKFIVSQSKTKSDDEKYCSPLLIDLKRDNDDYNLVYYQFLQSAGMEHVDIDRIFIYKITNKHLSDAYQDKKKQILKLLKNDKQKLHEFALYHGTDIDVVIKILHQGFQRQYASRSMYGKGTYFARDAFYSCAESYAIPDADDFQHVLLCNVICGEWCLGNSSMIIPPPKQSTDYLPFETTVNNVSAPSIFVTYKDDQAIPTYLISFKSNLPK